LGLGFSATAKPAGLSRRHRLTSPDIKKLLRSGRLVRAQGVQILTNPNDRDYARLAVAVPKKLCKRAVDRNRVKRCIREWFRVNKAMLAGKDFLIRISARTHTRTEGFAGLDVQLQTLCWQSTTGRQRK
jgi:ribonuclease P protein component